jgi:hypothetical protein
VKHPWSLEGIKKDLPEWPYDVALALSTEATEMSAFAMIERLRDDEHR